MSLTAKMVEELRASYQLDLEEVGVSLTADQLRDFNSLTEVDDERFPNLAESIARIQQTLEMESRA